jgi:protein AATF/BFR2
LFSSHYFLLLCRNAIIQKWYDKTRLTSGKSFESFEKPILAQIEHIVQDRERLIKRTQLKRSVYKIYGKEENKSQEVDNRHVNDYDTEVFDDQDFYNQLMRELIERKTTNIVDPVELSRKSIELQKLRTKSKKTVDTKASKGRKIKFTVHKPMVNFMAPIFRNQLTEDARFDINFCLLEYISTNEIKFFCCF